MSASLQKTKCYISNLKLTTKQNENKVNNKLLSLPRVDVWAFLSGEPDFTDPYQFDKDCSLQNKRETFSIF
jgi:hypothetical protein